MNTVEPKFYPIVDMHSTWLVLNPIQGCPKRCKYCFLTERGLNNVKPYELITPEEAAECLLNSNLYMKDLPLCLFSQTDVFSTLSNIEYAKKLVSILMKKNIENPIIFITKCKIPQDFINFIDKYEKNGHQFVFFLSYSGLQNDIEIGVDKELIKNNFINLAKCNKKIIHYWRPLILENSSPETIEEVYNFVKKYAIASVTIGLKITNSIIDNIGWRQLIQNRKEAILVNNVWSEKAYDYIWNNIAKRKENYPLFTTTSCALAYALGIPERKAYYNTRVCLNSNCCPKEQRNRCMKNSRKHIDCTEEEIIEQLKNYNYKVDLDQVEIDFDNKQIILKDLKLPVFIISFLTEKYKMNVIAEKDENDYYWNSELTNSKILKL